MGPYSNVIYLRCTALKGLVLIGSTMMIFGTIKGAYLTERASVFDNLTSRLPPTEVYVTEEVNGRIPLNGSISRLMPPMALLQLHCRTRCIIPACLMHCSIELKHRFTEFVKTQIFLW